MTKGSALGQGRQKDKGRGEKPGVSSQDGPGKSADFHRGGALNGVGAGIAERDVALQKTSTR